MSEVKPGPAPSDEESDKAWDRIMKLAQQYALIVQAYGGVATLALPREQRKAGIREKVLRADRWDSEIQQSERTEAIAT